MKPLGSHTSGVETVDEAVDALGRYGSDAKVLAGGQSLVPLMNLHLARPTILVDVNRVRSLSGIRHDSNSERVVIGLVLPGVPDHGAGRRRAAGSHPLPAQPLHTGHACVEFARRHGDFLPWSGVAAGVKLSESGQLVDVHLALCGVDAVPVRAREAEHLLVGEDAAPNAFEAAGVEAAHDLEPSDDAHGSAAYRRALVPRALGIALDRARDGVV